MDSKRKMSYLDVFIPRRSGGFKESGARSGPVSFSVWATAWILLSAPGRVQGPGLVSILLGKTCSWLVTVQPRHCVFWLGHRKKAVGNWRTPRQESYSLTPSLQTDSISQPEVLGLEKQAPSHRPSAPIAQPSLGSGIHSPIHFSDLGIRALADTSH